jgi:hypothetical protein
VTIIAVTMRLINVCMRKLRRMLVQNQNPVETMRAIKGGLNDVAQRQRQRQRQLRRGVVRHVKSVTVETSSCSSADFLPILLEAHGPCRPEQSASARCRTRKHRRAECLSHADHSTPCAATCCSSRTGSSVAHHPPHCTRTACLRSISYYGLWMAWCRRQVMR